MRKRKKSLLFGFLLIFFSMGLGYAFLTTTLNIEGIADIDRNTWNIYWDNVVVTDGSVAASTPVIDTNMTTVTFSVHLSQPGDFYEFTIDAKNDGTIDAMVDTVVRTIDGGNTIPSYLSYTVLYADGGGEILPKHALLTNQKHTYRVRVEYNSDINANELPSTAQSLDMQFQITYIQADSSAIRIRSPFYTYYPLNIGNALPANAFYYYNYQDSINAYGHDMFLKLTYDNNVISSASIGFVFNNQVYYLLVHKEGAYETNKAMLTQLFGAENCYENNASDSPKNLTCMYSGKTVHFSGDEGLFVYFRDETDYGCSVNVPGRAYCGYMDPYS